MQTAKIKKYIYIYYAILLFALMSWTNRDSAPNELFRIGFVLAIMLPAIIKETFWLPASLICFFTYSQYNFAYPLMPTTLPIYVLLIFVAYLFMYKRICRSSTPPTYLLIFTFYVLAVDTVTSLSVEKIFYCLLILLLLYKFVDGCSQKAVKTMTIGFVVSSLALSSTFLVNRAIFAVDFGTEGLERSGWTDANYFGMILGFGAVLALQSLLNKEMKNLYEAFVYVACIGVTTVTLVLNASRGAILSLAVCYAYILLFSKVKSIYRIFCILAIVIFCVWMFNNQYFELLVYRVENDSGTASGRTIIWANKLNAFFTEGNFLNLLFGFGYEGGMKLGYGHLQGSHNEYIAALVEYGFTGFIMLLVLLIMPIVKSVRQNKRLLVMFVLYLMVCLTTLEPLTLGQLPFWFFYFYICVLANQRESQAVKS